MISPEPLLFLFSFPDHEASRRETRLAERFFSFLFFSHLWYRIRQLFPSLHTCLLSCIAHVASQSFFIILPSGTEEQACVGSHQEQTKAPPRNRRTGGKSCGLIGGPRPPPSPDIDIDAQMPMSCTKRGINFKDRSFTKFHAKCRPSKHGKLGIRLFLYDSIHPGTQKVT